MRRSLWPIVGLLVPLFAPRAAAAIDLAVTGSWSTTLDAVDLAAGPGSDLQDPVDSASGVVTLDLSATTGAADAWRVDVRRSDTTWNGNVRVWVRRATTGTGPGTISGGTSWQEVTTTDAAFFTGAGDRSGVDLQVRITGQSVSVPVDSYATTLFYTVVDT